MGADRQLSADQHWGGHPEAGANQRRGAGGLGGAEARRTSASASASPWVSPSPSRSRLRDVGAVVALLLVLLGAFALRLAMSVGPSFWYDEAYSAVVARRSVPEILASIQAADFHPPFHYLVFHYWRLLAGEGELALRFTAVWAGTTTVALAFATGRRLFGRAGGFLAAVLFAASPFLAYYSAEARMFSFAALFALLALYVGHRAAYGEARVMRWWTLFGAVFALGLYNFYYALFAAAPVGLLALARRRVVGFVAAGALATALYLPWLPVLVGRAGVWSSPFTPPTTPTRVLLWTWPALLTGLPTLDLWNQRGLLVGMAATAALLVALVCAAVVGRRQAGPLLYAFAAAALPLLVIAAIAIVRPIYHPRYATPAEPGLLLALAGAIALPIRPLLPLRALLLVCVLPLFGFGLDRFRTEGLGKDDYRAAVGYLAANAAPGDVAITNALEGVEYYYPGPMPVAAFPPAPYDPRAIGAALAETARGRDRIWSVTHDLHASDPEGFVDELLLRGARPVEERRFGHLRAGLFAVTAPARFDAALQPRPALSFGDYLDLTSVGLDPSAQPSGGRVPLILGWRVKATPPADLGVRVRLRDDADLTWGRQDHQPRDARFLLGHDWQPGEEVFTGQLVPILPGTPPGEYGLEVGAYRLDDLKPLEVREAAGVVGASAVVGHVRVEADPGQPDDPALTSPRADLGAAVSLAGAGIGQTLVQAGNGVDLTLLWRAHASPGDRQVVLRIVDGQHHVVAERRFPAGAGRYPPTMWRSGDLVRDQLRLPVPPTLPGGTYHVTATLGDGPGVGVGSIEVTPRPTQTQAPTTAHPMDVAFHDGVRLGGWDLDDSGSKARLVLHWHPSGTPTRDYKVFVHAVAPDEKIAAQHDSAPADWIRPTTGWVADEWIDDPHELELPAGHPELRLRIGLYDPATGQRLKTGDADYVELTRIPPR